MPRKLPFLVLIDSDIPDSIRKRVYYCFDVLLSDYVSLTIHSTPQQQISHYHIMYTAEVPDSLDASAVHIPFILSDWQKSASLLWEAGFSFDQEVDLIRLIFSFISHEISWEIHQNLLQDQEIPTKAKRHTLVDTHNRFKPIKEDLKKWPEQVIEKFYELLMQKALLERSSANQKSGLLLSFDIDNLLVGWKGLGYRFIKGANVSNPVTWVKEKEVFINSVHKIINALEAQQLKAVFFMKAPLSTHKFDAKDYLASASKGLQQLLGRIKNHPLLEIGFHSSYPAATQPALFKAELTRLQNWASRSIQAHRSHYLRFQLPTVYQSFSDTTLVSDSSIAWSNVPYSHIGLKKAYPLYDFNREQPSSIVEIPLTFMDSQLCTTAQYTVKEIKSKLEQQISDYRTQKVVISWDFHHHVYDSLLNPKSAAVFEHALALIAQNQIQTFHTHEIH